ncbi:MAG: nuclear transport factor 2 (NTF2) superfamily protein [Paraglaciecola sp.]|jgi:nuclear transport factor 2 (NTF2) superfamily protein
MHSKPPFPPFTLETALLKVQAAEDAWNSKDSERVSLAYTPDCIWRNRDEMFSGTESIKAFLTRKWQLENGYRLKKTLWCFADNRIAVCFEYEWHDQFGQWYRSYGNENWEFAKNGLMKSRQASINDIPIKKSERKFVGDE